MYIRSIDIYIPPGGFNPFEKYARQIGSFPPIFGVKIKKYLSCQHLVIYIYTWNPNDLYFWRSTPQNKAFSNQNKGHLGSRYTYHICLVCHYQTRWLQPPFPPFATRPHRFPHQVPFNHAPFFLRQWVSQELYQPTLGFVGLQKTESSIRRNMFKNNLMYWVVWPPSSNSDHHDYCIFSDSNLNLHLPLLLGRGHTQPTSTYIDLFLRCVGNQFSRMFPTLWGLYSSDSLY